MKRRLLRFGLGAFGALLPKTAARWLGGHLMTPYKVPAITTKPTHQPKEKRLPYAKGWLRVWVWGEGPPVLLLHGWGGRGTNLGAFVDPLVDAGLSAVAFDLPAHGTSSGRRTNLIECAGAALQVGHVHGPLRAVIAHSFGAPVAALAWNHGLRAERMALLGPPGSLIDMMIETATSVGLPRRVCEIMAREFEREYEFDWDELRTDRLVRSIDVPLLVIHDEDDVVVGIDHGTAVANASPRGRLFTTRGLGHRGILTDPDVISRTALYAAEGKLADNTAPAASKGD